MAFFSWRDDYRVGVDLVDAQHRYLFQLINEFHDRHLAGHAPQEIAGVLSKLVAYAEAHFQHEEALLKDNGYPRLEHHQAQHDSLFAAIFDLNEKLASGEAHADLGTMNFLKRWLLDHILKEDMDYGDFMRRKALQRFAQEPPSAPAGGDGEGKP